MGRVKNWLMEMEEHVNDAFFDGVTDEEGVLKYVQNKMTVVNKDFVYKKVRDILNNWEGKEKSDA
jgi:hypothetical protein